jgi:general secretion pathway protein H
MFPANRHNAAHHRGFTLIEMLVVLAVLGLVAIVTLPTIAGHRPGAETRAAARELAVALRNARSAAMLHARTEAFVIDTASGAFRPGVSAPIQRLPRGVSLTVVTTTDDRLDATSGAIRFFADGSSSGGGVRVTNGDRRSIVLVDWLTGRVSIDGDEHAARP